MSLTPEGLRHLWRECVGIQSPVVGMWMRGIYIVSMSYDEGILARVLTRTLPQYTGIFKLTPYGRSVIMDCLEELSPGARWTHDESDLHTE